MCRQWAEAALPLLYRHLYVEWKPSTASRLICELDAHPHRYNAVSRVEARHWTLDDLVLVWKRQKFAELDVHLLKEWVAEHPEERAGMTTLDAMRASHDFRESKAILLGTEAIKAGGDYLWTASREGIQLGDAALWSLVGRLRNLRHLVLGAVDYAPLMDGRVDGLKSILSSLQAFEMHPEEGLDYGHVSRLWEGILGLIVEIK